MRSDVKTAIMMGAIIIGVLGIISISLNYIVEPKSFESGTIQTEQGVELVQVDKSKLKMAPDIVGIAQYINTTPEQLEKDMEGKVVLYDIWTYSCINCVRTLPYITAWDEKYSDQGLIIVGIHSPEFEFEKDVNNVKLAVQKHGINYPVALDNDWETWKAFENRYWPRKYIADHEGYIRYDHIGEGGYAETEKIIQELLKERSASLGLNVASAVSLVDLEEFRHTQFRTPELYFGYELAFGRNQLGNEQGFLPNELVTYITYDSLEQNKFYLDGTWRNNKDHMKMVSENGVIRLGYTAKQLNIVADGQTQLEISIDGKPIESDIQGTDIQDSKLVINGPALYNIINAEQSSSHLIEIRANNATGFEIYTFTFG